MQYKNNENGEGNGWICYNILNGRPDPSDPWFVTNDKFTKLYDLED